MAEPSQDEVDEFIKANDIDERAASDLRSCASDIQRKVLARGELSTARNPSAAVLARIRDARSSPAATGAGTGPVSQEVEDFIKTNDVDESAGDMLRSSSPTVQRAVLSRGELKTARNPSSATLARIRDAKLGLPAGGPQGGGSSGGGGGGGGYGMQQPAMPPGYGYPYGMYNGAAYGFPGYGGYPGGPQPDSRYGGGGYPGYPGYPASQQQQAAAGAYGAYGAYASQYAAYGGYPGYPGYPAGQYPGGQPALEEQRAQPTQASGRSRRSRSRGRSSSSSDSRRRRTRSRSRSRSKTRSRGRRRRRGRS